MLHRPIKVCFGFPICYSVLKPAPVKATFYTFLLPVKVKGGTVEIPSHLRQSSTLSVYVLDIIQYFALF